uniref:ANF_receptor domain-containing protein n=1 Tax=Syphacia muris TaxID=451379 RepID=A0A0N5A807_9BILA
MDLKGFECGQIDLNGFVRLAALIDVIERINAAKTLKDAALSIGAVVVDSCSSDLRTLADLYELLFGTNIERSTVSRSELIAVIRDDSSYLPNVDEFTRYLQLPIINTFFSSENRPMTTGMLPSEESLIEAIIAFIRHTRSTCVSIVYDDSHPNSAKLIEMHAESKRICVDGQIHIRGQSSVETAQMAVRKLLLTQARFVIIFVADNTWLHLLEAFRNEMVIAGRFVIFVPQSERWSTSLQFAESWPHFDQLLLSVTNRRLHNQNYINHLTESFPKLPFPQVNLLQQMT